MKRKENPKRRFDGGKWLRVSAEQHDALMDLAKEQNRSATEIVCEVLVPYFLKMGFTPPASHQSRTMTSHLRPQWQASGQKRPVKSVRLPDDYHALLMRAAAKEDRPAAWIVRSLLEKYFKRESDKKPA